jgi:RNA polymerase primary sigma factor
MGKREPRERDSLSSYLGDIRHRRSLSRHEEARILREIGEGGHDALNELVECNLGFVVKTASEYRNLGVPFEDLLNEGNLGLLEAARRFDPTRGTRFITYAIWWVRKSILQAVSQQSRLVRMPHVQVRKMEKVRRAESDLRHSLERNPSRGDLARYLDLGEREVGQLLVARSNALSLDRPVGREDGPTRAECLESVEATSEQRLIDEEMQANLERALRQLTAQQRTVIALRFGLGDEPPLTLQAAGERLRLSRERVRQIEASGVKRLRQFMRRTLQAPLKRPGKPGTRTRRLRDGRRPRSKTPARDG